jgi:menaquinone-dependent protoporphyrinogen oxidase
MRILVSAASRHGATTEIAAAIGETLEAAGHQVTITPPDRVADLRGIDAVVLGSGVYAGRWLGAGKAFVDRHGPELRRLPVWLFSSGPLGTPLKPDEDPADIARLLEATGARSHRLFGGRIDRDSLWFAEKAVIRIVKAAEGDYRPWAEIRAWAGEIAVALSTEAPTADAPEPALARSAR